MQLKCHCNKSGAGNCPKKLNERKDNMKKVLFLIALVLTPMVVAGCAKKCEVEPIVAENHKLIVPPNFGNMPK